MSIIKNLPFSLDELRLQVDTLDLFVKTAVLAVMKSDMSPADLGFPSPIVDELAHLHGLLDLAKCCVEKIEIHHRDTSEMDNFSRFG